MSLEQGSLEQGQMLQNELQVQGVLDASRPQTVLRLQDGRSVSVATESLLAGVRISMDDVRVPHYGQGVSQELSRETGHVQEQTIPLVSEQMQVGKRTVTTGTVRLHRDTETYTDTVGIDLTRVGWEVERVTVGQIVPERPEIRVEGEVTVFPLVEERLVARREYFLLEEVHVRRVATTTERSASLNLKRDVLTVERSEPAQGVVPPDRPFEE